MRAPGGPVTDAGVSLRLTQAARYAESIYPMVAAAIGDGLYLPRRSSNLCTRRHCGYWQTCEAEYGGSVRP